MANKIYLVSSETGYYTYNVVVVAEDLADLKHICEEDDRIWDDYYAVEIDTALTGVWTEDD